MFELRGFDRLPEPDSDFLAKPLGVSSIHVAESHNIDSRVFFWSGIVSRS